MSRDTKELTKKAVTCQIIWNKSRSRLAGSFFFRFIFGASDLNCLLRKIIRLIRTRDKNQINRINYCIIGSILEDFDVLGLLNIHS